jgi:hypothetical protein
MWRELGSTMLFGVAMAFGQFACALVPISEGNPFWPPDGGGAGGSDEFVDGGGGSLLDAGTDAPVEDPNEKPECTSDAECPDVWGECWEPRCEYNVCVSRANADGAQCTAPPGFIGTCANGGCQYVSTGPVCKVDGLMTCTGSWQCSIPPNWTGCGFPACQENCCIVLPC